MTTDEPDEALSCRRIAVQNPSRTNRYIWIGLALVVVGTPIAGVLLGPAGLPLALFWAIVALVLAARSATTLVGEGPIRLDADAVRIFRSRTEEKPFIVLPLGSIESGYETMDERTVVLRVRDGREVRIELEDAEPARVLGHVGVDVAQRVLQFPLRRTLGAFTIGFIAFWPLLLGATILVSGYMRGGWAFLASLALAGLGTALVVARLGFPRVVVGADGVRFLGTLPGRFFAYDAIERVETLGPAYANGPRSLALRLRSGKSIALPTVAAPRERIEGLMRRIEKARANAVTGAARRLDGLARGGRTLAAWRADIERLVMAAPGFRDNATGRDDFERVLADAAAPADQRVGAALALRVLDPTTAAPRIRVAAEASADETLREALAAAAEGEVEEALLDRATLRRR